MAANNELTNLEQLMLRHIHNHGSRTEDQIISFWVTMAGNPIDEVRHALSNLIAQSYVSADADLCYSAVGGAL